MSQELADLLSRTGLLTDEQLREAYAHQRNRDLSLARAIVDLSLLDEASVTRAVAKLNKLPFVDLSKGKVPAALIPSVPAELAREQRVLPVAEKNGTLVVAIDDPLQRLVAEQLQFQLGRDVQCALAAPAALAAALEAAYGAAEKAPEPRANAAVDDEGDDAPVVRLVSRIFADAVRLRASDIHLEPAADRMVVRLRVDGVLRPVAEHPQHLAAPLLARLKVMASLDIAEKRKPQDGRIEMKIEGRPIDVRVSILPSNHGETLVMRILDRGASLIGLKELGFDADDHAWFRKLIARPHGIVLVTGPTGSGKTTTLYAALNDLNRPDVKIITAEDPVEYHISGVNQVQVHPKIGLTFARILKAMLRSAPNVILVGEIRDLETAEVAVQAALTGHLVFSTLHTNDAPSALTRLVDMGVQPFLASAAVQGIVAQRLVRRLCPECAESVPAEDHELRALGLDPASVGARDVKRPKGCAACEGAGYKGRLGLFELLELDTDLRERIYRGDSLEDFRRAAVGAGRLRSLLEDGARKVLAGRTSVDEVLRVARAATGIREADPQQQL